MSKQTDRELLIMTIKALTTLHRHNDGDLCSGELYCANLSCSDCPLDSRYHDQFHDLDKKLEKGGSASMQDE